MMVMVGTWLFGSYSAGRAFMLVQAFTVFLALIGTTLSCLSTGARVTYAMGKDEEVPGALRHAARQDADAAPLDLDAGDHLGGHRHRHRGASTSAARRRRRSTRSTTTSGTASASSRPGDLSPSCRTRWSSSRWSATSGRSCSTCSPASSPSWPSASTTCSTASSTCSCRCSAWWPTCSACCST